MVPHLTYSKLVTNPRKHGLIGAVSDVHIHQIYTCFCPKAEPVSWQDEGYSSPTQQGRDVWDEVCEAGVVPARRRTWEQLGATLVLPEPPYLSEAGPGSLLHVWQICKHHRPPN